MLRAYLSPTPANSLRNAILASGPGIPRPSRFSWLSLERYSRLSVRSTPTSLRRLAFEFKLALYVRPTSPSPAGMERSGIPVRVHGIVMHRFLKYTDATGSINRGVLQRMSPAIYSLCGNHIYGQGCILLNNS